MANNNMYLRCLICHPRSGQPVDWDTEMDQLHYLASMLPGEPWFTKREGQAAEHLNGWLEKHHHWDDPRADERHFELVDESRP